MSWIGWLGPGLCAAVVGCYWAYTLLELRWLRPVAHPTLRLVFLLFGIGMAWFGVTMSALAVSRSDASLQTLVQPAVALFVACALSVYAWRRQWLFPRAASSLSPVGRRVDEGALVVVLPSGDAVPILWLEQLRVARAHDVVITHCGLSRATAAFRAPVRQRVAAWLPHASGFWVGGHDRLWDGVDGRSAGRAADLEVVPLLVTEVAAWRDAHPGGALLGPARIPSRRHSIKAVTRSARGVADGARWGVVSQGQWSPLTDAMLSRAERAPTSLHIARWAALARGIPLEATGS